MKIIVAVVVYDRFSNVIEWIRCFKASDTKDAELVIIHNCKNEEDIQICQKICIKEKVKYVPRGNMGYDIGAMQDVFRERLVEFPNDWDFLLWVTDDVIPMWKQFISAYLNEIQRFNVGITCLEISTEVRKHIRTSGFIISKETSKKIEFPADIITTKDQCYEFEHRGSNTLLDQITKMNKLAVQVSPTLEASCLWDTEHRINLNRWKEHFRDFPRTMMLFICPIYNSYPQIISSLLCQTNPNWQLLLIHDGKNSTHLDKIIRDADDDRIIYMESETRHNDWGHSLRQWALQALKNNKLENDANFIVITNPDNYYMPVFVEEMLKGFANPNVIATYCSGFVHAYLSPQKEGDYNFGVITTELKLGMIDCGGVAIRRKEACDTGWNDLSIYSDWTYFDTIINKYGADRWNKVLGCLFVHN